MDRIHYLKIAPKYFKEVKAGIKTFEIRKNNRNFQVGDTVILQEYENGVYTGAQTVRKITYIITSEEFKGISIGYCVFGMR